jgi:hypothetical protein
MNFKLPDLDLSKSHIVYVGGRGRYATATDAVFVDDNKILVASFLGKKIYLIDISSNNFNIIDQIDTVAFNDIIDYSDGLIITTNFPSSGLKHSTVSIFELKNNKITNKKNIKFPELKTHGCAIVDKSNVIITSTYSDKRGIYFLNLETEKYRIFNDFEHYPKDVYIKDDRLLILCSAISPSRKNDPTVGESILYLYEFSTMRRIDELHFYGITDAVCLNGQNGFITLQDQDSLLHFNLIDDKLSYNKLINGFNFPHGVASKNNKLIVTNYGDNSIDIIDIDNL